MAGVYSRFAAGLCDVVSRCDAAEGSMRPASSARGRAHLLSVLGGGSNVALLDSAWGSLERAPLGVFI